MLHVFHGNNVVASRKELHSWREKYLTQEIVNLNGKTVTATDLVQATESTSLFGTERLVIVENIFSVQYVRKSKEVEKFVGFLKAIPGHIRVIFWEEKEISKSILSLMPKNTDIALFRPDRQIFTLVESLKPGNTQKMLELYRVCLSLDSPEMIFTMVVRQIRILLMSKDLGKNLPDLSPWQISKVYSQAPLFTQAKLLYLYRNSLDIDIRMKTGSAAFDLTKELELFLIDM